MTRSEFQRLSQERLEDAQALLLAGRWSAAYYLVGYAVECALKACIAKRTRAEDFPPDRKTVEDCYTHDISKLVKSAGLTAVHGADMQADQHLESNWRLFSEWSEKDRYALFDEVKANQLIAAVTDPRHGVLQWCKRHW